MKITVSRPRSVAGRFGRFAKTLCTILVLLGWLPHAQSESGSLRKLAPAPVEQAEPTFSDYCQEKDDGDNSPCCPNPDNKPHEGKKCGKKRFNANLKCGYDHKLISDDFVETTAYECKKTNGPTKYEWKKTWTREFYPGSSKAFHDDGTLKTYFPCISTEVNDEKCPAEYFSSPSTCEMDEKDLVCKYLPSKEETASGSKKCVPQVYVECVEDTDGISECDDRDTHLDYLACIGDGSEHDRDTYDWKWLWYNSDTGTYGEVSETEACPEVRPEPGTSCPENLSPNRDHKEVFVQLNDLRDSAGVNELGGNCIYDLNPARSNCIYDFKLLTIDERSYCMPEVSYLCDDGKWKEVNATLPVHELNEHPPKNGGTQYSYGEACNICDYPFSFYSHILSQYHPMNCPNWVSNTEG